MDNPVEKLDKNIVFNDKQALARQLAQEYAGSTFVHDDKGRLVSAQDLTGGSVSFAYDENNNLTEVTDPRGVLTQYEYDGFGQLTKEISAERGTTKYKYDAAGNKIKETRAGGLIIKRDYDALNRLTREVFKQSGVDRKVNRYSYDHCDNGVGRLCRVTSGNHITRYAYNALGQYTKIETKTADSDQFETVRYDYGTAGRLAVINYPTDLKVRYIYSDAADIKRIVGWYGREEDKNKFTIARNIQLDPVTRQITSLTYGNGIKSKYDYTEHGYVASQTLRQNGERLDRRNYSYDDRFNVTKIDRQDSSRSQNFTYDALGRLTQEQGGPDRSVSYSYDASGNRLSKTNSQGSLAYGYEGLSNQLTTLDGKTSNFDERGNLIEDRNGKRAFAYDVTNRMTAFYKKGKLQASYSYNAFGQRISKVTQRPMTAGDDHKSLSFAYTPNGQLLSETGRKSDKKKSFTHEYVWLGGVPLAKLSRKIKANGRTQKAELTYIHTDHLSAPRRATNEAGETIWLWDGGDAFGHGGIDKDPDGDGKKTNIRLRFAGQYFDQESGLYYNHHRDYDPRLGRYIQSDPIGLGDGINRYNYVKANPVNYIDPTGLKLVTFNSCSTTQIWQDGHGWVDGSQQTTCTTTVVNIADPDYGDALGSAQGDGVHPGGIDFGGGLGGNVDEVAQLNPEATQFANCKPGFDQTQFPTRTYPSTGSSGNDQRLSFFGPRVVGPFETFPRVVNSAISALNQAGPLALSATEGVTIFQRFDGYYRSLPNGQGFVGQRGVVDSAGIGSRARPISSVVTIDNSGHIGKSVGSRYVAVRLSEKNESQRFTCGKTFL